MNPLNNNRLHGCSEFLGDRYTPPSPMPFVALQRLQCFLQPPATTATAEGKRLGTTCFITTLQKAITVNTMDDDALYRLLEAVSLAWYSDARKNEQDLIDLAEWLSVPPEQLRRVIHKSRPQRPTGSRRSPLKEGGYATV